MLLAQKMYEEGSVFAQGWNFGPNDSDAKSVEWIVQRLCERWHGQASYRLDQGNHPHEATYLKLDCSKAKTLLDWQPRWHLEKALDSIVEWTQGFKNGEDVRSICLKQIDDYLDVS
jgi:CDP-glucose 4,6-dehydratase